MRTALIFLFLQLFYFNPVLPQSRLSITDACSYYGEKYPAAVYSFTSDDEASSALRLITDASGLAPSFKIMAANVPNALATVINNERYILYNQSFMYNISQRINYWASISILAHEVGHHLNGHSLKQGGSRPTLELEADKFSGFILAKLGSTLEDAQSAINLLVSEEGSFTHPGRSARLAAIANGWYSAGGKRTDINKSNAPTYSTKVGFILPNFTQKDQYGNLINLTDFRGKYVLVNFWASWSKPDREENKNLVLAYNEFKAKGFTVLGVSLDNSRLLWLDAIEKDGLNWTNVSDLKFWENEVARKFSIVSVPSSFLLDPNGKIIAKDLRGDGLLITLRKIFY